MIRSRFDLSSDLMSAYSLHLDLLLHPDSIRKILKGDDGLTGPSDYRYAYRTIWLVVVESLHSVLRVGSYYRFWNSRNSYLDKAEEWAKKDKEHIEKYLAKQFGCDPYRGESFHLLIEEHGAVGRFWLELS